MVEAGEEPSELIVGRDAELARVDDFLARARTGVATLMVTGAPGTGKSSFLRAYGRRAQARGVTVVRATGAEFETEVAFAGLHELLMPHEGAIAALIPRHRDALLSCLGIVDASTPSRSAIAAATLSVLTHLSGSSPVLVVIDDAQWLDRPTAGVLAAVANGLSGPGLGLLCALRDAEHSPLEDATPDRVRLGPLSLMAAAELLARRAPHLDTDTHDRVLRAAHGNPLALLELALQETKPALGERAEEPALPERLRALFAPQILDLPASTREFLLLAALDTSSELLVVLEAGGHRISDADVRVSVARGLLSVEPRTRALSFNDPLIRSTVVDLATPGDRRGAHRALGEAEPHQLDRKAWHLAESLVAPDEPVAVLLEESADLLLRQGDPAGAVSALLRSADVSERSNQRARRTALAAYVGATVTGELGRVPSMLAGARNGDASGPGSLDSAIATAYALLHGDGDIDTAHRLLARALGHAAGTEDSAPERVVEALYTWLWICFFGGRSELWEEFTAHLERVPSPIPVALRLCLQTFARPALHGAAGVGELRSVVEELDTETDLNQIALIGRAAFYVDELDGCRAALWRVVNQGSRSGALTPVIDAWILLGFQAFLDGQWTAASHHLEEGLALSEGRGYELLSWPARYGLGLVAAATGDDEVTARVSDEMLLWAQPRGVRSVAAYAHHVQALAALGRSDFTAAIRYAGLVSRPGVIDPSLAHALWVAMDLVEAAVHSGRHADALAHVAAMRASDMGRLSSRCALMLAASEAMVCEDEDLALFEKALGIPGADSWPFELARVQLAYGGRLHRARQHTRARDQLSSALDAFMLLGATPWIERARSELDASGDQRGAGLSSPSGLTARELEVAELAAGGLSNAQIATRLHASARTVSAHISHVLAKLDLTSRSALRDALSRIKA